MLSPIRTKLGGVRVSHRLYIHAHTLILVVGAHTLSLYHPYLCCCRSMARATEPLNLNAFLDLRLQRLHIRVGRQATEDVDEIYLESRIISSKFIIHIKEKLNMNKMNT